jgi:hypothetical protein
LAAALLFPAVAAIHGIVLPAMHVNGAVDMDVYGAFQFCTIGILAAPLTVRRSRTYFNDPGRNMIFLWTVLILAGLLGLAVEFYRVTASACTHADNGNPISLDAGDFPYEEARCGLVCSVDDGPRSSMRAGSANNIYIIPVPSRLTFNTAMLLAAACCLPAILSLIFTWDKIVEINWKRRFGNADEEEQLDEPIEGTNGATPGKMRSVNEMVRQFLSVIEIPLFGGAVLAILCIGEINFFSTQVMYQTERVASIGQWAPIAGTCFAALGSLYLYLTGNLRSDKENPNIDFVNHHCDCLHHDFDDQGNPLRVQSEGECSPHSRSMDGLGIEMRPSNELASTLSRRTNHFHPDKAPPSDPASRRRVARWLTAAGNYLGNAAHDRLGVSGYNHSRARDFPEIPGEEHRNPALPEIRMQYSERRELVLRELHSRTGSSAVSISSASGVPGSPTPSGPTSPHPDPSPTSPRPDTSPSPSRTRGRRDTLDVPSPAYHRP